MSQVLWTAPVKDDIEKVDVFRDPDHDQFLFIFIWKDKQVVMSVHKSYLDRLVSE